MPSHPVIIFHRTAFREKKPYKTFFLDFKMRILVSNKLKIAQVTFEQRKSENCFFFSKLLTFDTHEDFFVQQKSNKPSRNVTFFLTNAWHEEFTGIFGQCPNCNYGFLMENYDWKVSGKGGSHLFTTSFSHYHNEGFSWLKSFFNWSICHQKTVSKLIILHKSKKLTFMG